MYFPLLNHTISSYTSLFVDAAFFASYHTFCSDREWISYAFFSILFKLNVYLHARIQTDQKKLKKNVY